MFAKQIDYKLCRIPANAVTGEVVYCRPGAGHAGRDLGRHPVRFRGPGRRRGRQGHLPAHLPHAGVRPAAADHRPGHRHPQREHQLDREDPGCRSDIQVRDQVLVLPKPAAAATSPGETENLPIVEALPGEGQEGQPAAEGEAAAPEPGEGSEFQHPVRVRQHAAGRRSCRRLRGHQGLHRRQGGIPGHAARLHLQHRRG